MKYTKDDIVELLGCEEVGGNLIAGEGSERKFVARVNEGVFEITEHGLALLRALEGADEDTVVVTEKPRRGRKPKEEVPVTEGAAEG
jgi:hypothetical protein